MLNRRTFLASSAAASFFSYAGLSAAFADTPRDILVVVQQLDNMTSLDPHESFEAVGSEISSNCYQKLVKANIDKPSEIIGDLAESWEAGADGKTMTFRLRKDAKFASGQPVTAEDAAFSLQRAVIMNKGPAFIINQFGFTKDNVAERVKAADTHTLVLTLQEPTSPSFLLYCLSANVGSVVEKKVAIERLRPTISAMAGCARIPPDREPGCFAPGSPAKASCSMRIRMASTKATSSGSSCGTSSILLRSS
jgi:peptide/nickel transport system substrate-binding protein